MPACNNQDAVLLSLSTPSGSGQTVQRYSLQVQDRQTRDILYQSGPQALDPQNDVPVDLSSSPFKLGVKLAAGQYLFFVHATADTSLTDAPVVGEHAPELFFADIVTVSGTSTVNAQLLQVNPAFDADGDHFPSALTWPAQDPAAQALYAQRLDVLDCVDVDPAPNATPLPAGLHAVNINPLAAPRCGGTLDVTCSGNVPICIDADGDGDPEGSDCDDHDPRRFHGNPRPRNCCQCTDHESCANDHAKIADLSLCQPARCGQDTIDYDCTGRTVDCFVDNDCDGYSPDDPNPSLRDCDDTNPNVHPGATKICADPSHDWACDGNPQGGCVSCDLDGDGYQRNDPTNGCPTTGTTNIHPGVIDCDDDDRGVFPGSNSYAGPSLIINDLNGQAGGSVAGALRGLCRNHSPSGVAQDANCDNKAFGGCPSASCDVDGDGFPNSNSGNCNPNKLPLDCNDNDPHTFPGAPDKCGDGIKQNCVADQACTSDNDKDGYNADVDCDDGNANVHPWAAELCNGVDDDCDGLIDELNPDPTGKPMIESHTINGTAVTSTTSCTDSNVGDCGLTSPTTGTYSGRCVCSGVVPTVTLDNPASDHGVTLGYTRCPGTVAPNDAPTTGTYPRCFGADQPYTHLQSCIASQPHDEDCDGRTDAPDGVRLAVSGNACGVKVGQCVPSTVIGCNRQIVNQFFSPLPALGFPSDDQYYLCANGAVYPVKEICNGFDDDCNGSIPGQGSATVVTGDEADHDHDAYMACTGCPTTAGSLATGLKGCGDCNDLNATIYPGAPELCDGLDNDCTGTGGTQAMLGSSSFSDGSGDCKMAPNTKCCEGPPQCINALTNFQHCGSCSPCSSKTADNCAGGACLCATQAACTGGTPVCKGGVGCVQCLANTDCSGTTPKCNTANDTCVQCLLSSDCKTGQFCNGSNVCQTCSTNGHCGTSCVACGAGTPVCKSDGSACVACNVSSDCGAAGDGLYCNGNSCDACNTNSECGPTCQTCGAGTPVCKSDGSACVQCNGNGDCQTGQYCTANTCQACTTNSECGSSCSDCVGTADPVCKSDGSACVQCNVTADCPAGKYCNGSNACVACNTNSECGSACTNCTQLACANCASGDEVCSSAGSACVQCNTSADCAGGQVCKTGGNTCVACNVTADCQPGNYCSNNTCQPCNTNSECGAATCYQCSGSAEPVCSMHQCVCQSSAQCSGTDTCSAGGACVHACMAAGDCSAAEQGPVCLGTGFCGCATTADCTGAGYANTVCSGGVCTCGGTLCKSGQTCTAAGACM